MYSLDVSTPLSAVETCLNDFDGQLRKKPSRYEDGGRDVTLSAYSMEYDIHNDVLPGNYQCEYSTSGYCCEGMENEEAIVPSIKNAALGDFKLTLQDYPTLDSATTRPNTRSASSVAQHSPWKCHHYGGFDLLSSGLLFGQEKQTDFHYGLDALIHGVQLGFGPQPSFRMPTPNVPLSGPRRSQELYYDLEPLDNVTTAHEPHSPRGHATAGVRRAPRKRSDDGFGDPAKGKPKLPASGLRERRKPLADGTPHLLSASKREAFASEAQGYMQEVDFILNQLIGKSDGGKSKAFRKASISTGKVSGAALEALLTGAPAPRRSSQPPVVSSRQKSLNLLTSKVSGGKSGADRIAGEKPSSQENALSPPLGGKKKNMEMEYPVLDDNALRLSLLWPGYQGKFAHSGNSAKGKEEPGPKPAGKPSAHLPSRNPLPQQEQQQQQKEKQQRSTPRDNLLMEQVLGEFEYLSAESLKTGKEFDMANLVPLFPRVTSVISGKDPFGSPKAAVAAATTTSFPHTQREMGVEMSEVSAKKLEEQEEYLLTQEQRIVEARRQAGNKAELRTARMVVMDNRYAPKPPRPPVRRNSSRLKKLVAQQKENEERRARVQAFLEKRRAERALQEEVRRRKSDEAKTEQIPKRPSKPNGAPVVVEESVGAGVKTLRRSHQRLRASTINHSVNVAAPYLDERPLGEESNLDETELTSTGQTRRLEKNTNRVRSLVVVQKPLTSSSTQRVKISLEGDTTVEIRQCNEQPRFFKVDEYLEYEEDKSLYSMNLIELRRKFLSGLNVALFLAGSESALLVSWRAVREVMEGVFRDLGDNSELFLSVALVRQGLTQDLLSESGRMMRSTVSMSPLLGASLDDVGYTKLQDLLHFSKLLAHAWELARFHQAQSLGFIAVSIILKQVKDGDVVLSSMLVTSGDCSVNHLNVVLSKGDRKSSHLFSAALGGSCFTVAVLALCGEDGGIVQLMNTQRRLASIVNKPGTVGSVKRYVEHAEKELAECKGNSPREIARSKVLREQIALAKNALRNPKSYVPKETFEELQKRREMRNKAKLKADNEPTPQVSATCKPQLRQHSQMAPSSTAPVQHQTQPQVRVDERKPPAPPAKVAAVSARPSPSTSHEEKATPVLPALRNPQTVGKKPVVVPNTPGSNNVKSLVPNTSNVEATPLVPVERRKGRRHASTPPLPPPLPLPEREPKASSPPDRPPATVSHKEVNRPKWPPLPVKRPTAEEQRPSSCSGSLGSTSFGAQTRMQSDTSKRPPVSEKKTSDSSVPRCLSESAPVGPTASTRYIGRAEVPQHKLVFHDLDSMPKTQTGPKSKVSSKMLRTSSSDYEIATGSGSSPVICDSADSSMSAVGASEEASSTQKAESRKMQLSTENSRGPNSLQAKEKSTTQDIQDASTKVRTLVVVDPRCNETANVTHDGTMVIVMTDDDFEEYEVDEVVERPDGCESMHSKVLNELRDAFLHGCNAALLAADSRSSAVSALVLKSVVHDALTEITGNATRRKSHHKGALSVSIVQLRGEMALDLLKEGSIQQKLVIAISPIYGPCVHNVKRLPVDSAVGFDSILTTALTRAAKNGREYGIVFVSLLLKQRMESEGDVLVSSLVTSMVGENVGQYAAVLDRSPLVPRALFHYALGGPCYTVALLGFSADETRANEMLEVQKRLGEMMNRPTHRGSIIKFISGIRNDLAPSLREKLQNGEDRESTEKILKRLEEMASDAEALLVDFEHNEPRAYLNDVEQKPVQENRVGRKLPLVTLTGANDGENVRSLVCFEQRTLGDGTIAVQGNSVLARIGEFACRYDVDEVVVREPGSNVLFSKLIDGLVAKFVSGHDAALLAADSRNSAVTPLILSRIAYLVVNNKSLESHLAPVKRDLLVSIALVKDDVTVDLLAVDEDLAFHRFEVEASSLFSHRLRGTSYHHVSSAESFDRLLAVAVDRAEPALRSEDPGIMVVSFSFTQHIEKPERDVIISSLMATTVFDGVSHYAGIMQNSPDEPTELFKVALGGACHTVAMLGLCDEDEDAGQLLSVQMELAHVHNRPSRLMSVKQHIVDLKKGIVMLRKHLSVAEDEQQKEYLKAKIAQAESFLRQAEALLQLPLREKSFVPLGALM
ncbi:hypothetical protein DQ04_03791000 [Trypanosoma grayi]|uniref:hypothetical protein n=1 Tax=Trypanosoma grayi TaxID=71804 RepID=UPI0004F436A6|nr:hypothetical protein DQ04_03791000 [Trypanosoma grayi]KEG10376.1 hypothetical protein DQ04_03791000 [Trypanosoma grayi]